MTLLRRIRPEDAIHEQVEPVDAQTLAAAAVIVEDVKARGEAALREHAQRLKDLAPEAPLIHGKDSLDQALRDLPGDEVNVLNRAAERIRRFADAQRQSLSEQEIAIPGGRSGHKIAAIESAGCYAPGGRFPLPSSVLMTVVTARAAGVKKVWVASPKPSRVTLAAAAIAGWRPGNRCPRLRCWRDPRLRHRRRPRKPMGHCRKAAGSGQNQDRLPRRPIGIDHPR